MTTASTTEPYVRTRAVFLPVPARAVAASLRIVSGITLLVIFVVLVRPAGGPANPLWLIRVAAAFHVLPMLVLLVLRARLVGTLQIDGDSLVLEQRRRRVEIPVEAILAVEPWRVPLPDVGVSIHLRSGRRWSDGIMVDDPIRMIDALVDAGAASTLRAGAQRPSAIWARARGTSRRGIARRLLVKFPAFALVPTLPLFRVHQIIAYGSWRGEYLQYGMGPYLTGFAIYWATLTIYLLAYAAVLRVPVEVAAFATAVLAPRHASHVRRLAEHTAAALYYVGVPVAVVLRFLPW